MERVLRMQGAGLGMWAGPQTASSLSRAGCREGGMTVVGTRLPGLGLHSVVALLGLHVGYTVGVSAGDVFILSEQAQRFLALQSRSFATEFMGCMIGEIRGDTVRIDRIAPADVDPSESTATWVVPKQTCEGAGWAGTVGMIHSHPSGERCWYH